MGTDIRAEITRKSPYWIPKHRYYELKHFCLQYQDWRHELSLIDGYYAVSAGVNEYVDSGSTCRPTEYYAEARMFYERRIEMVNLAAQKATDDIFGEVLVDAVTNGLSYEKLMARGDVNCGKEAWYAAYRRFFWILDKLRK